MIQEVRVVSLKPYRIVDRMQDEGGIVVERAAFDAAGDSKFDAIEMRGRDFIIPADLMFKIVRTLEAYEDDKQIGPEPNGKAAIPAARLPRRHSGGIST